MMGDLQPNVCLDCGAIFDYGTGATYCAPCSEDIDGEEQTHDPDCAIALNGRHACSCGIDEIAKLREENQRLQWVDVNDRRPPKDGYYLVACEGGNVDRTFYCNHLPFFEGCAQYAGMPTRRHQGKYGKYFELAWEYGYRITHWMPVPKAPTKQLEASDET